MSERGRVTKKLSQKEVIIIEYERGKRMADVRRYYFC